MEPDATSALPDVKGFPPKADLVCLWAAKGFNDGSLILSKEGNGVVSTHALSPQKTEELGTIIHHKHTFYLFYFLRQGFSSYLLVMWIRLASNSQVAAYPSTGIKGMSNLWLSVAKIDISNPVRAHL